MGARLTMDEQLQEDWLETRLREETPYIDEAGFTAQVVQKIACSCAPALVSRDHSDLHHVAGQHDHLLLLRWGPLPGHRGLPSRCDALALRRLRRDLLRAPRDRRHVYHQRRGGDENIDGV